MSGGPCYRYDFTICESGKDKPTVPRENVVEMCIELGKKWCFQLEDTGENRHYQGRISLKNKTRPATLTKRMKTMLPENTYIHTSPTSNMNVDNDFYVCKEESRIDGPWTDIDIENEPTYIPRQIRELVEKDGFEWRPFQRDILATFDTWDTRKINVLIDCNGNIGKTIIKTTAGVYKRAMTLPMINDYKDILRMVMDMPKVGGYIIDMPRAIKKEKLFQLYSAIETIKDGYAFDDRYTFKYEYFDCPIIWVFCNTVPDTSLMSKDRWNLWCIDRETFELVPFCRERVESTTKTATNIDVV